MKQTIISDELLEAICNELDDDCIHTEYSGRGMYGETCFGFSGCAPRQIAVIIGSFFDMPDLVREFAEMLATSQTDSFGLGQIVYFPVYTVNPKIKEASK